MSFQGTINQGIGTIGAMAGVKKVIEGQQASNELAQKTNDLAKAQQQHLANKEVNAAQRQLETAKYDLDTNEVQSMAKAKEDKETWDKASKKVEEGLKAKGEKPVGGEVLDEYQKQKLQMLMDEREASSMQATLKPSKAANIRLQKATEAYTQLQGEIEARRQLKFNLKQAQSELDYAKEYQSILGGKQ